MASNIPASLYGNSPVALDDAYFQKLAEQDAALAAIRTQAVQNQIGGRLGLGTVFAGGGGIAPQHASLPPASAPAGQFYKWPDGGYSNVPPPGGGTPKTMAEWMGTTTTAAATTPGATTPGATTPAPFKAPVLPPTSGQDDIFARGIGNSASNLGGLLGKTSPYSNPFPKA
jgi:hypothetical protein